MNKAIEKRQNKEKGILLEQLKKTPIIQIACEKIGIGRATYYRWRSEDQKFADEAEKSISDGASLVNDMAESQLMSAIRDKNMTAVIFWLKHHHASYATKVEVTAHLKSQNETLTPEQEAIVTRALQLASLISNKETKRGKENDKST
ncbi:hypothetical protein HYZ78_00540 [Candidatus Microgenomates bacterium]|nr:hypothetical protein [Candidatus Microgenomates bacterium]